MTANDIAGGMQGPEETQGRLRVDFDESDLEELLHPSPYRFTSLEDRLRSAGKYMRAVADCLEMERLQVSDPKALLVHFEEVFLTVRRLVADLSEEHADRMTDVEGSLSLSQNIVMLGTIPPGIRGRHPGVFASLRGAEFFIPGIRLTWHNDELAPITRSTMLQVKTALHRLSGVVGTTANLASELAESDRDVVTVQGIFEPWAVRTADLNRLLLSIMGAVEKAEDIPEDARAALRLGLTRAMTDLGRPKTPWSRVLARITQVTMLLAALVTIAGGVDDASDNLVNAYDTSREAIELFQDQAVIVRRRSPRQPPRSALPRPSDSAMATSQVELEPEADADP